MANENTREHFVLPILPHNLTCFVFLFEARKSTLPYHANLLSRPHEIYISSVEPKVLKEISLFAISLALSPHAILSARFPFGPEIAQRWQPIVSLKMEIATNSNTGTAWPSFNLTCYTYINYSTMFQWHKAKLGLILFFRRKWMSIRKHPRAKKGGVLRRYNRATRLKYSRNSHNA